MRIIDDLKALTALVGEELGVSDWATIDQGRIDRFAEATGDHQWIHVDVERARRESPFATTIAHGYLTLSLVSMFLEQIFRVDKVAAVLNYGCNRVRFPTPVPVDSQVRGRARLVEAEPADDGGVRAVIGVEVELKGSDKPACVADVVVLFYPVP